MPLEIVRRLRLAVTRYVAGRGHGYIANIAQLAGDETSVSRISNSHNDVDAFLRQIGNATAKFDIDYEFRIQLSELRQIRGENLKTKTDRQLYPQSSAGFRLPARYCRFGILEFA